MGKATDKYNQKTYSQIAVRLEKELVQQFKEKLQSEGQSMADFFRQAIIKYLNERS